MQQQYSAQKVFDGKFGAIMDVSLVNDVRLLCSLQASVHRHSDPLKVLQCIVHVQGPVTIILDSETPKG